VKHYCTYFDRGYLAQGVALLRSLRRLAPNAAVSVLALDNEAAETLRALALPHVRVVPLAELLQADAELAAQEKARSRTEFIFALTPCLVRHMLATRPDAEWVMYLDADLFFFSDPEPIWKEAENGNILVVPHRFPSWHDDGTRYGQYNVGVLVFRRGVEGEACLAWWRDRCLESTALAADAGRYGDQKYLDEWPERFSGVVVARHPGVNLAPWNWARHNIGCEDPQVSVDGEPLVVFHFAQFRRVHGQWFDSGQLEYGVMPRRVRTRIYGPYVDALVDAVRDIATVKPGFVLSERGWRGALGRWPLAAVRLVFGQFWWCGAGALWSGRFGLGRFSGRVFGWYRRRQRVQR
jgi:hypothetical protein